MAAITFPNYTQIPSRLSLTAWRAIRAAVWLGALVVAGLLVAVPDTGLDVMWKGVIPALPLLFMVAPGVWRKRTRCQSGRIEGRRRCHTDVTRPAKEGALG